MSWMDNRFVLASFSIDFLLLIRILIFNSSPNYILNDVPYFSSIESPLYFRSISVDTIRYGTYLVISLDMAHDIAPISFMPFDMQWVI